MIRLLVPLAIVSLGLSAEEAQPQGAGAFVQAPLASVQQPQYYFPQHLQQQYAAAQPQPQQQYFQYQPQAQPQQQFYFAQQAQQQQQQLYYPYQPYQQLQYSAPVQPAFEMSPKLTIPTGLLRKHINASSNEPSVFAMSYNPETGIKVATINGKKVFAYKQRFPGAPKEDVEIVENGEVNTSGNPVVVASTTENEKGEKTKNVWFDDKDDPMVKIEKDPIASTTIVPSTTVDPNLPVVNQDGDEKAAETTTVTAATEATTAAVSAVVAAGVTVTPVPAAAAEATTVAAAVPAAAAVVAGDAVVTTTTAAPTTVVPTTMPVPGSQPQAFFAAQNPMYMANVAAFSKQYPQYFPTPFAQKPFPAPFPAAQQLQQPQYAAFPTTVAPAAATAPLVAGSGLSQVHPVYAQSAISTTPFPQAVPQYIARPVAVPVAVAQPRPVYMPQPTTAVPIAQAQAQYIQTTPVPVAPLQQFQSTVAPVPQQYLQPEQQPQFVQQPQQQQYLQPTPTPQPVPQYIQTTTQPQQQQPYFPQPQPAPVPQHQYIQPTAQPQQYLPQPQPTPVAQHQQPQYIQQQPAQQQQQYQQPHYPAPAPAHHQYAPPPTPAYNGVQPPAPPQDFTEEELRPAEPAAAYHQNNNAAAATSTAPPGISPDERYHVTPQYQQANGYESTTPEPERPIAPPRYQPAPSAPRYEERPAENELASTPGYGTPEHTTTTYAPRPAPTRRPYYPRRPTTSYSRPAYRQPYHRPQQAQRPAYNPNRKVTYYRAGTYSRPQQQQPYHGNSYAAPRPEPTTTTQSSIPDYVPSPAYKQHNEYRPQPQYTSPPAQPQYASHNAYSHPPAHQPTTTTEEPAPGEHYYARVNNNDQSKVEYQEAPFENMEFLSTPFPTGQKKDVKVTFINRHRVRA